MHVTPSTKTLAYSTLYTCASLVTVSNGTWAANFAPTKSYSCETYIHPFNGPFSRTTRVSRYQKGKTNLDFTEARDSEWQWHQLGHTQVCNLLQTDNHASTPPLKFFTGRMPFLPPNQQHQSTEGITMGEMGKAKCKECQNYCLSNSDTDRWRERVARVCVRECLQYRKNV